MANGQRTAGAVQGATLGAAAGPVGAGIGAGIGYAVTSISSIFGHKKKPKVPKPPKQTFLQKYGVWLAVGGVGVVVVGGAVVIVLLNKRK